VCIGVVSNAQVYWNHSMLALTNNNLLARVQTLKACCNINSTKLVVNYANSIVFYCLLNSAKY